MKYIPVYKAMAVAALACCTVPALAQKAGDNVFGVGWFHIAPNDSSETLKINGVGVPNSAAGIDNADTLGLTYTRFVTDNVGITLDLGIPPTFHLAGEGSLSGAGEIGSAKQWSPALLAKYYFGGPDSQWRPFLGGGVSYVRYSDISLTPHFQQVLSSTVTGGASPALKTSADLSSSWAPVVNAGINYNINKNWAVGLSISYLWLKTDATLTTRLPNGTAVRSTTRLTIDPLVTLLSLNYRF